MMPLAKILSAGDDRLLLLWAGVIKQAIRDLQAPPTDRKVTRQHRRTAEALLRRHGYLREDGSVGRPLDNYERTPPWERLSLIPSSVNSSTG